MVGVTNVPNALPRVYSPTPARVTMTEHGPGFAHTKGTIKKMCELAREGSHTYEIRHLATEITRGVPSKSPRAELEAIYRWVRDNIRYRYDPLGLEWVQSPWRTVQEGAGDCDDMTVLICALSGSLGHQWRMRTVGPTPTAQAHVQAQVHDRKGWVDLDPVLEPTQKTTAPRSDLGMFGCKAVGCERLWDQEGNMLSGTTHRRRGRVHVQAYNRRYPALGELDGRRGSRGSSQELRGPVSVSLAELIAGMHGPVSAELAQLWYWNPYYSAVPPTTNYGIQPPQTGKYPTPNTSYRSLDAPGFDNGKPATYGGQFVISLPLGAVPEHLINAEGEFIIPVWDETLGAGFLKKVKRGLKKVGKGVVKGVQAVGQAAHKATHSGVVRKIEKGIQNIASKTVVLKPFVDFHEKVAAPLTEKALKSVGMIKGPTRKLDVKGGAKAVADYASQQGGNTQAGAKVVQAASAAKKALPASTVAAVKKVATTAKPAVKANPLTKALTAATSKVAAAAAKVPAKPAAKPAAKPSPLAKVLQTAMAKAKPAAVKPAAAKPKIPATVTALKPKPPAKAAFKKAPNPKLRAKYPKDARMLYDPGLKKFRVFVPSKTAALHGFRPSFTITLGAPVPASARPDVVALAKKALSAIQTFMKNHQGKPPQIHLPAVHAFQHAELGLTVDGLYGSNTKAALAYYLPGVKLPAVAPGPKFNTPLTWKPQEQKAATPKPVAPKPTPAPKPVAPKPVAPTPAPKPAQPVAVVTPKPSFPTPSGYTEVGQEVDNPGLTPVGYEEKVGTAKPVAPKPATPKPTTPVTTTTPVVVRTPVQLPPPGPHTDPYAGTIVVDKGRLVDVSKPAAPPVPPIPSTPTDPLPDQRPLPAWPVLHEGGEVQECKDNTLLWAAALYFFWKSRRRAA